MQQFIVKGINIRVYQMKELLEESGYLCVWEGGMKQFSFLYTKTRKSS